MSGNDEYYFEANHTGRRVWFPWFVRVRRNGQQVDSQVCMTRAGARLWARRAARRDHRHRQGRSFGGRLVVTR